MNRMAGMKRVRLVGVAVAITAVLAAWLMWLRPSDEPAKWRTVTVHGVGADIPSSWKPVAKNECGFQFAEHQPRSTTCVLTPGVEFFGSALFDPSRGPGLTHAVKDGRTVWFGYVNVGDTVVATSSFDRHVAKRVLESARKAK